MFYDQLAHSFPHSTTESCVFCQSSDAIMSGYIFIYFLMELLRNATREGHNRKEKFDRIILITSRNHPHVLRFA